MGMDGIVPLGNVGETLCWPRWSRDVGKQVLRSLEVAVGRRVDVDRLDNFR